MTYFKYSDAFMQANQRQLNRLRKQMHPAAYKLAMEMAEGKVAAVKYKFKARALLKIGGVVDSVFETDGQTMSLALRKLADLMYHNQVDMKMSGGNVEIIVTREAA